MNILLIHKATTLAQDIYCLTGNAGVSIVEVDSPDMAVECLSARSAYDLVVVSMAAVWGGSSKWDGVVAACGKRLPCVFIPDTSELLAISGVVLNSHVVCPLNTPVGRSVFSSFVRGLVDARRSSSGQNVTDIDRYRHDGGTTAGDAPRPDATKHKPRLTKRQRQVLEHIVAGKSNREIADELNLAQGTIKLHSIAIYRQLGVSNRIHAILRAQQLAANF